MTDDQPKEDETMKDTVDGINEAAMERALTGKRRARKAKDSCANRWAFGPCMPRIRDGRCIWCERELPPAK